MANALFTNGKKLLLDGTIDWDSLTGPHVLKVMLLGVGMGPGSTTYSFNAAHTTVADVVAYEVVGTGYANGFSGSGRKTITPVATAASGTDIVLDASDAQWPSAGGTWAPSAAVIFRQLSTDAANSDLKLIAYIDTGTGSDLFGVATNGSNLDLIFSANGIIRFS